MNSDSPLPQKNKEFRDKEYWDSRYEKDKGTYEWFKDWSDLKEHIADRIPKECKLLHVGCGNSALTEGIYDDIGDTVDIYNVDYSPLVIATMKSRNEIIRPKMKWLIMDALDLEFGDESFDIVLEKGTFDAILGDQDSVHDVCESTEAVADQYISEMYRVLKRGGRFIYITFSQPHFRKPYLLNEKYEWTLELLTIGESSHYFIYILTKKE